MFEAALFSLRLWRLRRGDRSHGNDYMRMYFKATQIEDKKLADIYFQDLVDQQLSERPDQDRLKAETIVMGNILWLVHYMNDIQAIRRNFQFYDLWDVYEKRKWESEFAGLRFVIVNENIRKQLNGADVG